MPSIPGTEGGGFERERNAAASDRAAVGSSYVNRETPPSPHIRTKLDRTTLHPESLAGIRFEGMLSYKGNRDVELWLLLRLREGGAGKQREYEQRPDKRTSEYVKAMQSLWCSLTPL